MTKTYRVTLDTAVAPSALKVHDHGHIHVDRKSAAQTLAWTLSGSLAGGEFVPMDEDPPGFRWIGTPPPAGIFGTPQVVDGGGTLSVSDDHDGRGSDGRWIYQLRVRCDGTVYSTTASTGPGNTVNDPTIVNH